MRLLYLVSQTRKGCGRRRFGLVGGYADVGSVSHMYRLYHGFGEKCLGQNDRNDRGIILGFHRNCHFEL